MMRKATLSLLPLLLAGLTSAVGCAGCENLDDFSPAGAIEPPVLDLGVVVDGQTCEALFTITNNGGSELSVRGAELRDLNGNFLLTQVVDSVGIGGTEPLSVTYTAEGTDGDRQSATVVLMTNDPDNEGEISATVTALSTGEAAGIGRLQCPNEDATAFNDCTGDLNFGAVNIQDPVVPIDQRSGLTKEIKVVNKGNAPMTVTAAVLNNGNPDFIISGVQQGDVLIPLPVTLDPGVGECGAPAEGNHELVITVFYSPTALGADADTLVVLTDAIEGATLELPLTGAGSDIGILLTPPTLAFGDVAEGDTAEKELIVSNLGTNDAAVNSTCIDLEDDGTCDADCTGADDDTVLDGALKCRVFKMNGDNEGKGFILLPTDAQEGGNDERRLVVTWSPVAGNATIPAGAVLRLETAILNNRVWTARILGGSAGNLVVTAPDAAACPGSFCVQAAGDPADVMTWSGSMTLHFANDGMATLDITSLEWEGPGTIADDFQLLDGPGGDAIDMDAPGITLGPGQSIDLTLEYLNNDFSGQDLINLIVNHTGLNLRDTVPIGVAPPPQP